ncbi:ATP-binding protein [Labrys monachus]|uniref:Uncharacterized protein YhaN n=1 Tax=Labrys monachus TaxID=217067 RepID=A0ABU0FQ20_9HYPH|nr:AAA family ATPase [Labrys monachus]MDQ0396150.1 uncharacterized protein YhaN [Labrys monachus]
MRLTRLDLDRYGPFTGTVLELRPDAALHIVHGANEAGKSSALAAITDLLYGFELRSPANFRHRYEDLRIGAHMRGADGRELRFWRRKRNRNSLTDDQDAPLDEALLEPMLGGISRDVFLAAFGLGQSGLREGARQMLAAQGEVGESLFAAASGLRTLIAVRAGLDAEADGLFGVRRSSKRAFYEAQDRYDAARKALREQSLRADDVRELDAGIAAGEARAAALAERLKEAGARRSRIDRVRRVAPLLAGVARAEEGLAALAGVPDLPPGSAARIETALAAAAAGRETLARIAREVADAEAALAAIAVDEAVLAAGEAIVALNDERAALAKALQDLARRQEEAREAAAALDDFARRLGQADRTALARLQPSDLALERIRVLAERRRAAELSAAESDRAARRAGEAIGTLAQKRDGLGAGGDPEPLRRRLQAMRPALAEAAAARDREADLARRRSQFDERLARLSPAIGDRTALWSWPAPPEETVAAFEQRFSGLEAGQRQDAAEAARLEGVIAASRQTMAAEGGEGDLVDDALLARRRAERDDLFDVALADPRTASVNAYRRAVMQVDDLADRRLGQVERLARRDMAAHAQAEAAAALEAVRARQALRSAEEKEIRDRWQALFAPLGCAAEAPAVMRRFLAEVVRLRELRAELAEAAATAARAVRLLEEERPALEAIAAEAGLAGTAAQSLPSLIRLVEDRLDGLDQWAREARSLDDRLAAARLDLARAETEAAEARAALSATQEGWTAALAAIGLIGGAGAQEAAKATELWLGVQGKLAQLASLEHRIAAILEDREGFVARAAELAGRLLPGGPAEAMPAAAALMAALNGAREAAARRHAARQLLARHRAALGEAAEAQRGRDEALAALAAEAGCEAAGLAALAGDLNARLLLQEALREARDSLAAQGDGLDEAALRQEAASIGADQAAGEIAVVQAELAALAEEDKQAALALVELRRRREAIEREAGAAGAAQRLQDARSDLERIARDYLVLKAASLLIDTGLERQLRTEQGPLIAAAGALFATITENAFAGIATLYDDDDRLRLAARRPGGETIAIEGLSEGTRDQLYLALRLANLEAMAARRVVPPFIGDDLVITFDERRVAATLAVLAAGGSPLQKILFTHHRHVAEIAKERLGDAVDVVTLDR